MLCLFFFLQLRVLYLAFGSLASTKRKLTRSCLMVDTSTACFGPEGQQSQSGSSIMSAPRFRLQTATGHIVMKVSVGIHGPQT